MKGRKIYEDTEIFDKDTVMKNASLEKLVKAVKENTPKSDYSDLKSVLKLKTGKKWWTDKSKLKKEIQFTFRPSAIEKEEWEWSGIHKLSGMLTYLKKKYGDLSKFEIVFFRENKPKQFYFENTTTITKVYVNFDQYEQYHKILRPEMIKLKIFKYQRKISIEYGQKVAIAFFEGRPPESLVDELKASKYRIIEDIINEYESMDDVAKQDIKTIFRHSTLADDTIKEFKKLKVKSPEKQLKLFLKTLNSLNEKEIEILLKNLLSSKSSKNLFKAIKKLPAKEHKKISKNLSEMARMYDQYDKLETGLKEFIKKINDHKNSNKKNEKDIHRFLVKNYWLLGIEYFGSNIESDIDEHGKRTGKTNIGNKRADFIILRRLNGLDSCTVIEIEEANDAIFNPDKTISKKVYDGIVQAVDYNLEQKARGIDSRGMAIIGSLKTIKLNDKEKFRLNLLRSEFPNIEILTYEDLIQKAKATLRFWKQFK